MSSKLYTLTFIVLLLALACNNEQITETPATPTGSLVTSVKKLAPSIQAYNNTKGYWENGSLVTDFDCPDSKWFAPIDIKAWNKTHVVNGRFPTYEETMNGTSIHHYGEKANTEIKPYDMILPKLAYYDNGPSKLVFDSNTGTEVKQQIPVVVIQIAQTATDTVIGYRYLTGGCGGGKFYKFHFLSDEEVRDVVANK